MVGYKLCNHNAACSIAEKLLDNHRKFAVIIWWFLRKSLNLQYEE